VFNSSNGTVGDCWYSCSGGDGQYFASIISYGGIHNFTIDVWQDYIDEIGNANNATIPIELTSCVDGGVPEAITCQCSDNITATITTYNSVDEPPDLCSA
jgi:hypothetical protein